MYMHYTPFFGVNSTVIVIMSSRCYILKYMIWSSPSIVFHCVFSCNGDYPIQRHHFSFYKIQDKVFLINVKIKIQDKKAHLRQCHSNYLHSPTGPCALHMDCAESMQSMQKPIVTDLGLKSHSDSCRKTLYHQKSNQQLSDEIM